MDWKKVCYWKRASVGNACYERFHQFQRSAVGERARRSAFITLIVSSNPDSVTLQGSSPSSTDGPALSKTRV